MKQNLNSSKKRYLSPFPGKKENEEFMNNFTLTPLRIKDKNLSNIRSVYVPSEMTKSYMTKNPFYFDLKNKVKKDFTKNKKNKFNSRKNLNSLFTQDKSHQVIDKYKIFNLLNENCSNQIFSSEKLKYLKENNLNRNKRDYNVDKKISRLESPIKKNDQIDKNICNNLCKNDNFGIVPEYIKQFKIRETIEKEFERLTNEEKKYPNGTIKLSESERLNFLAKIKEEKENLLFQLRSLPVSSHIRSIKIQNIKRTLESKLEEIEYVTKILERNEVFIKK